MSMCADVYAVADDQASRLMADPAYFAEITDYQSSIRQSVSLEKSWHGVFYLISGSAWEPEGPIGLIATGGVPVPESDGGYGEARLLTPADTMSFGKALSAIDDDQYWARFDPEAMHEEGIYPDIWGDPEADLREEYVFYFNALKELVSEAATGGRGLLVVLQ